MQYSAIPDGLRWMLALGLSESEMHDLNPCVPGEFTHAGSLYVNTGSADVIYRGTEEGTLPLVTGRWYLVPSGIVQAYPALSSEPVSIAQAVRLIR
ncbi:MAG: hypothetical protein ACRDFX_04305 [Chloroflexota bacterium]